MCWNSTAPRLWWKESGKWICYLWGLKIQTVQGWLRKKECECALREEKPTVSHRCDRHWLIVFFFFFCHIARNSYQGWKKWENHFVGSESLSVMTVVIFVTWLPLLFANCKSLFMSTIWTELHKWVSLHAADSTRSLPLNYFLVLNDPPTPPSPLLK